MTVIVADIKVLLHSWRRGAGEIVESEEQNQLASI